MTASAPKRRRDTYWWLSDYVPARHGDPEQALLRRGTVRVTRVTLRPPAGPAVVVDPDDLQMTLADPVRAALALHAGKRQWSRRGVLTPYTPETLIAEGFTRLRLKRSLSRFLTVRTDGDVDTVRRYDLRTLNADRSGLETNFFSVSEDPQVTRNLLAAGHTEIYRSSGAWTRLDRPDWNAMPQEQALRLIHGLLPWQTQQGSITLGYDDRLLHPDT